MNIREFSSYLAKNTNGKHFCQKPYNHVRKLVEAGFIKLGECRKNPRGRPSHVYKMTAKGAGLNNILQINAARKAAKMTVEG